MSRLRSIKPHDSRHDRYSTMINELTQVVSGTADLTLKRVALVVTVALRFLAAYLSSVLVNELRACPEKLGLPLLFDGLLQPRY